MNLTRRGFLGVVFTAPAAGIPMLEEPFDVTTLLYREPPDGPYYGESIVKMIQDAQIEYPFGVEPGQE